MDFGRDLPIGGPGSQILTLYAAVLLNSALLPSGSQGMAADCGVDAATPALGRRLAWNWREIVNAIFYTLRSGCPWRFLPEGFPPWQTVYRWFAEFRDGGLFERINHALVMADRERVFRHEDAAQQVPLVDQKAGTLCQ